jgi:hypothetical protein
MQMAMTEHEVLPPDHDDDDDDDGQGGGAAPAEPIKCLKSTQVKKPAPLPVIPPVDL